MSLVGPGTRLRLDPVLTARSLMGGVVEVLLDWINGDLDASADEVVEHFTVLFTAAALAAAVGGGVESPEAAEEADVFSGLPGGDGDRGNAELRGEDLGDLADRHALVAGRVQHRPGWRGLEREAEQTRGVVAVDRRPAVGAVADVGRGAFLAREPDRGRDEPVVAVAVRGRRQPPAGPWPRRRSGRRAWSCC
jgi:hypothetical protein